VNVSENEGHKCKVQKKHKTIVKLGQEGEIGGEIISASTENDSDNRLLNKGLESPGDDLGVRGEGGGVTNRG